MYIKWELRTSDRSKAGWWFHACFKVVNDVSYVLLIPRTPGHRGICDIHIHESYENNVEYNVQFEAKYVKQNVLLSTFYDTLRNTISQKLIHLIHTRTFLSALLAEAIERFRSAATVRRLKHRRGWENPGSSGRVVSSDLFQELGDLPLGDQKVTLNHQDVFFWPDFIPQLEVTNNHFITFSPPQKELSPELPGKVCLLTSCAPAVFDVAQSSLFSMGWSNKS